jgi:hypothetical protein
LMSGGGESMGSIGRGKSGFGVGGCSIAILQAVQHSCLNSLSRQTSNPIARISARALLCSTTPGRMR